MLNGLDLFSGIGGISLALSPWVKPIAYCENDRYAQAVLLSRMRRRELTTAPIWDDITTLVSELLPREEVDIIYGGPPCQDISVAGTGKGLAGERSGLVFEVFRLIRECRPRFVFLENVPALAVRGLDRVLLELHALGYDARWTIVSAAEMGAPHLRERIWILAHAHSERIRDVHRRRCGKDGRDSSKSINYGQKESMANSENDWSRRWIELTQSGDSQGVFSRNWVIEPNVGRVAHGIPLRMDRLRGLGNAVVPAQAREAFMRLMGIAS